MNTFSEVSGAVVLTTHERSGYFTSVLGENIDLRFDYRQGSALQNVLHNTLVAGGNLAIIDEAFFINLDDLAHGLEYFISHEKDPHRLKIIVVCTHREAGDFFLAYLVMYCSVYNIIYGKSGVEVSLNLMELIKRENSFCDVAHLAKNGRWKEVKKAEQRRILEQKQRKEEELGYSHVGFAFGHAQAELRLNLGEGRILKFDIDVSGEIEDPQ